MSSVLLLFSSVWAISRISRPPIPISPIIHHTTTTPPPQSPPIALLLLIRPQRRNSDDNGPPSLTLSLSISLSVCVPECVCVLSIVLIKKTNQKTITNSQSCGIYILICFFSFFSVISAMETRSKNKRAKERIDV